MKKVQDPHCRFRLLFWGTTKRKGVRGKGIRETALQYKQDLTQNSLRITATFNGKTNTDKEIIKSINSAFKKWMSSHDNTIEREMLWIK